MKVGNYVRTKRGIIGKIKLIDNQTELEDLYLVKRKWYYKEDFIKSSPNIIDLIEEGDYVNGSMVMDADWFNESGEYEEGLAFPMYASDDLGVIENWLPLKNVNIKSIVTKEQFKTMEYKIGEKI